MRTAAIFFDGRSAEVQHGTLVYEGATLKFTSGKDNFVIDLDSARLAAPVGSANWVMELADGGRLEWDHPELGQVLATLGGSTNWIRQLESSWHWALLALVVAVAGAWSILTFGVPVAARHIAYAIPPDIDKRISEESIKLLDRGVFQPSALPESRKEEILRVFADIRAESPEFGQFRLEFRASNSIGANAFAVPGGLVIITDKMVELIENDAELISVLAHEVGHLAYRHGIRILLQNSASAVVIAGLTGDLSNITALSATVPTFLMQAKYSRDFEREADDFAFRMLETKHLDTRALSKLLQRVESTEGGANSDALSEWLSSHPDSVDRVPE